MAEYVFRYDEEDVGGRRANGVQKTICADGMYNAINAFWMSMPRGKHADVEMVTCGGVVKMRRPQGGWVRNG